MSGNWGKRCENRENENQSQLARWMHNLHPPLISFADMPPPYAITFWSAHYILAEKKLSLSLSRCHCLTDSFCADSFCFSRQNSDSSYAITMHLIHICIKPGMVNHWNHYIININSLYLNLVVVCYEKQSHKGYIETANTALRRYGFKPKQHWNGRRSPRVAAMV